MNINDCMEERGNLMNNSNHTFAICAYRESAYLEECIQSLMRQSVGSHIIMAASTPNAHIEEMAAKYNIPLYINEGESGITQDWNFALSKVGTRYATLAHQDDIYEPEYTRCILEKMGKCTRPIIAFSGYQELRCGEKVYHTRMLKIKRFMLLPVGIGCLENSRFVRRRVLSLGDPICCPAVTFCMDNIPQPVFRHGFRSCGDWEAWEILSREKGAFLYVPEPLMCHRIHEESATTAVLADCARVEENFIMYCKFWPKWIARIINKFYTKSEMSNDLESNA